MTWVIGFYILAKRIIYFDHIYHKQRILITYSDPGAHGHKWMNIRGYDVHQWNVSTEIVKLFGFIEVTSLLLLVAAVAQSVRAFAPHET